MRGLLRAASAVLSLAAGAVVVGPHLGCSRPAPPGPATVRGSVTFQGRPLPGGVVVFTPDKDRGTAGKPIRGELGPDGTFKLHDTAAGPQVPPGWYRVSIAGPPGEERFPPQLRRPDTSGVVREVTPGKEHVFEFAVEVPNG
jgi:hypothetical protein